MRTKLYLAVGALAVATGASASPMALQVSGDIVLSDSQAAVTGSRYTMTLTFDSLAKDYSSDPGRGLYGGIDALVSGFDFRVFTPSGALVGAAQRDLARTGSNSLVSVIDDPRGDSWYLTLFGKGLRLGSGDADLPDFRFTVELEGGTEGVTSKSLASAPRAASFSSALVGFFHADNRPLLIGTVSSIDAVAAVPEPGTWALMALGLAGLAAAQAGRGRRSTTPAPAAS